MRGKDGGRARKLLVCGKFRSAPEDVMHRRRQLQLGQTGLFGGSEGSVTTRPTPGDQISVCSEISNASSTSMPRLRTVDSSFA